MLTDLSWLSTGKDFPPECEKERLKRYKANKDLFNNKHGDVYKKKYERIMSDLGDYRDRICHPIILNFQKKVSLKTADFLFMEAPIYSENVQEIVDDSRLNEKGYQAAIDDSRFGDAVLRIDPMQDDDSKAVINISTPEHLFTVVDSENTKIIKNHALVWITKEVKNKILNTETEYLNAVIHYKGYYDTKKFKLNGKKIGKLVEYKNNIKTNLSDFAVIPIHNLVTSDSVYGIDDYGDIDSVISELEIVTAQIARIIDQHSNPTVSGAFNNLEQNEDGSFRWKAGEYYVRDSKDDPKLEYVIWDSDLGAAFKHQDKLLNFLSVLSEMGAVIINTELKTGNIPSGSALRRLYHNALAKVGRLVPSFDYAFKKAISLASEAEGYKTVKFEDIEIKWQDGLPNDPLEQAKIAGLRTPGKSTASVKSMIQFLDGKTADQADDEIAQINNEAIQSNPLLNLGVRD